MSRSPLLATAVLPWLFLFSLVFFCAQVEARPQLMTLASDPTWLKLGHYEQSHRSTTGWRSAIHSRKFFLASDGRTNPRSELEATLAAFAAPIGGDPDHNARCRFPARWLWLKSRLPNEPVFRGPNFTCPAFDTWTRSKSVASISIVFVTGYLANPASYYGHTLLKFNYKGDTANSRLMDVSVNFGAILERHDDPVTYIVKSVTGGYEAGFSHIQFYFHDHNYGDNELRDMWEYQLDLPQEAVDLIVGHSWEVLGNRYDYGFFRQNCAYRMAEILEVVDGLTIIPKRTPWIIPQDVIEEIGSATYRDRPILANVKYIPSRQSRFYEKYRDLAPQDAELLKALAEGSASFDEPRFQGLSVSSKQQVLDALLDYYQYVGSPWDKAPRAIKAKYAGALTVRYQLAPGSPVVRKLQPKSPHLARSSGWLQTAWLRNTFTGDALSIRIRPAYYDVLDTDSGNVRNSGLVMGDLRFKVARERFRIEKLDLIGIESASPGLTGIAGDERTTWKLHLGVEQARLGCDDCLVGRFQGDYGFGRQWSGHVFSAVYAGGAFQSRTHDQGVGFARLSADVILRQSSRFGLKAGYEERFPLTDRQRTYGVMNAEARWAINTRADIRVDYDRDKDEQIRLGIGFYW